jgi:hypothetical protein
MKAKKKNNSLKLFNKLAKRAYKVSKKRKLDWKWSDAQKWTSNNLFKKYKGTKNISKLKVTEIDVEVIGILDGTIQPTVTPTQLPKVKKSNEICFNPFEVGSFLLDSFEWFDIDDKVSILNNNLKVDLDLEFEGNVFAKTGVIKKAMLPNLVEIRETMRKVTNKSGYYPLINFYIVLIEGEEDNREIACNYYVLITFEDSFAYNLVNGKGLIRKAFVTKEQMPTTEQERIELIEKQKEEDRKKLTRDKAKNFKLPEKVEKKVEPKAEPKAEPTTKKLSKEELKTIRWQEFNKAKESYRKDLDDGIITKKEYKNIILKLESKLEKGGKI